MTCPSAHRWELFHGGSLGPDDLRGMARHLEGCEACQTMVDGIERLDHELVEYHAAFVGDHELQRRELLAALPQRAPQLPWARRVPGHAVLRAAAAVALMVGAAWWWTLPRGTREYSESELAQSMTVVQFVLGHACTALESVEDVAVHQVIGGQVSGAVERLPLNWKSMPLLDGEAEG